MLNNQAAVRLVDYAAFRYFVPEPAMFLTGVKFSRLGQVTASVHARFGVRLLQACITPIHELVKPWRACSRYQCARQAP